MSMEQFEFGQQLPDIEPAQVKMFQAMRNMAMQHSDVRHRRRVWDKEMHRRAHGHNIDPLELAKNSQLWLTIHPLDDSPNLH